VFAAIAWDLARGRRGQWAVGGRTAIALNGGPVRLPGWPR
jgi:hypothetical protein